MSKRDKRRRQRKKAQAERDAVLKAKADHAERNRGVQVACTQCAWVGWAKVGDMREGRAVCYMCSHHPLRLLSEVSK